MIGRELDPDRRRGHIVAILGDFAVVATLAGAAVLALLYGWRALWRWL